MTEHRFIESAQANELTVIHCLECGFWHLSPLPDDDATRAYYIGVFYETGKPDYLEQEQDNYLWSTQRPFQQQLNLLERDKLEKEFNGLPTEANLLDVGAGYGFFVRYACQLGIGATALEPSNACNTYMEKQHISNKADAKFMYRWIDELPPDNHFNAIRMAWVLEHVVDPQAMLIEVKQRLLPGGLLLIIVPNDFSPLQEIISEKLSKGTYWLHYTHINYFNYESLARLLRVAGFEILHAQGTYPMELFLLSGRDYLSDSKIGDECHAERKKMEMNMDIDLLNQMQENYAKLGIGRDIVMLARKPRGFLGKIRKGEFLTKASYRGEFRGDK